MATTDPWTTGVTVDIAGNTTVSYPLGSLGTGASNTANTGLFPGQVMTYHPQQMMSTGTTFMYPYPTSYPAKPMHVTDAALNEDGLILDVASLKVLVPKELLKRLATLITMAQLAGLVEADDVTG